MINGEENLKGEVRDFVIGVPISVLSFEIAISRIMKWADERSSRVVCICNAHSLVTARHDPTFYEVLKTSDMATADGAPVAAMLRFFGHKGQMRINGPDLMWRYCAQAEILKKSIFLYGSGQNSLRLLTKKISDAFPALTIAGAISPPFRELTAQEKEVFIDEINSSGAGVVWVGLGCPKQEMWMHAHKGRINAVMVGVGAAFDYHAGVIQRAPVWMQSVGLEWLHRLLTEPRRLLRRYVVTNTFFIYYAVVQIFVRFFKGAG